jgi:biotin transport system substrate-specific component
MPVMACAFVAMIAVASAFGSFSIAGVVPVTLQNLFMLLAALFLGPFWGFIAALAYLGIGALGAPVFSKASGGLGTLLGPTGGYLFSYLAAVPLAGLLAGKKAPAPFRHALASVAFVATVYLIGVPWLAANRGMELGAAIAAGCLPFLLPDAIKVGLAVALSSLMLPWFRSRLGQAGDGASDERRR